MSETVEELFVQLKEAIEDLQDKKVVELADKVLAEDNHDQDALKCKIVAQIQLGVHLPETLSLFARLSDDNQAELALEKSYLNYRMGKLDEAESLLAKVGADRAADRTLLLAQIQYRRGRFSDAAATFELALKTHARELEHPADVSSNVLAAYVSSGRWSDVPRAMESLKLTAAGSGFEAAFNYACFLVESGRYDEAAVQLEVAGRLGRESLMEDDVAGADLEAELAPVASQTAQLAWLRGDPEAAKRALESLAGNSSFKDPVALAIVHNNLAACKGRLQGVAAEGKTAAGVPRQPGAASAKDLLRVLDRVLEAKGSASLHLPTTLDQRLSDAQKCTLHCNRALLLLLCDKLDESKTVVNALVSKYPLLDYPVLLRASILAKEGKTAKAVEALDDFCKRSPDAPDSLVAPARLMQLQLLLSGGRPDDRRKALDVIKAAPASIGTSPAVLSTGLSCCVSLGAPQVAEELLTAAIAAMPQGPAGSERRAVALLELADVRTGLGDAAGAMDCLDKAAAEPSAPESIRSAAVARALQLQLASGGAVQATKVLGKLAAQFPAPYCGTDITQLEAAAEGAARIAVPTTAAQAAAAAAAAGAGGAAASTPMDVDHPAAAVSAGAAEAEAAAARRRDSRKRKRERDRTKFLAAKGYSEKRPAPQPDPERWLPKHERSDFKKKMQKKKEVNVKGSQGAGKVDESLDAKNRPAAAPAPAAPAAKGKANPSLPKKKQGKK